MLFEEGTSEWILYFVIRIFEIRVKTVVYLYYILYTMTWTIVSSAFMIGLLWSVHIHAYLSTSNLRVIQSIIKHPDSPDQIRQKAKQILCKSYLPWAYKQSKEFTQRHRKLLLGLVKPTPLIQYAMMGYLKSIEKYNGSAPFHLYAKHYIRGSMYRGLTELTPLKPYKHKDYYKYRQTIKNDTAYNRLVPYENYWTFDKLCVYGQDSICNTENLSRIEQVRLIVDQMDAGFRRLFYLRYDYVTLTIKMPIDNVCELMGFSNETYRKRMNVIMKYIREQIEYQTVKE